jgi:hypothetical protein
MSWVFFDSCSAAVPLPAKVKYVVINPGRFGYYRANYSEALWAQLAEAARDPQAVSAVDLAGKAKCIDTCVRGFNLPVSLILRFTHPSNVFT